MKLSEIKGERVFDVVADVIDPIVSIALDENAAKLFKREKLPEGMTDFQFFLTRIRAALPPLLRDHKDELVTIVATVNDVDKGEYLESMTLPKLMHDLTELLNDPEFMSFFG